MAYLAFIYDTYYCHGVKESFAGAYADREEACERLRGGRWEFQHLELMDSDTFGITVYEWLPLYNYKYWYLAGGEKKETLTHSWDETKPVIELEWDGNRRYGHNTIFFDAGRWKERR